MRGWSQAALARASGLSQGAIASYENRSRKSTTGIIALAQALDVDPVWLHTGKGDMAPASRPPARDEPSRLTPPQLRDHLHGPFGAAWPFSSIDPAQYWDLPATARDVIEQTMNTLIRALASSEKDDRES